MENNFFSPDYNTARKRFLEQTSLKKIEVHNLYLDMSGPFGEELAIDIAWIGSKDPSHIILHTSGLHGVEGFAGSAIQLSLLKDKINLPKNTAVIFGHIINPFGMAWCRRVNEENVDLNRNFLIKKEEYNGESSGYKELSSFLNPLTLPNKLEPFLFKSLYYIITKGFSNLKQAIAAGQYERPSGLFYGGKKIQRSIKLFSRHLEHLLKPLNKLKSITAIDIHTGLGPSKRDTLFLNKNIDSKLLEVIKKHSNRIKMLNSDDVPYKFHGGFLNGLENKYQDLCFNSIYQEFGTIGPLKVLKKLKHENQWTFYKENDPIIQLNHWSRKQLLKAFNPENENWKMKILNRGKLLFNNACAFISDL